MPLVAANSGGMWPVLLHVVGIAGFMCFAHGRPGPHGGTAGIDFGEETQRLFPFYAAATVLYFPFVFGLKQIMVNHAPMDLKGASPVNVVFWWNQLQAVFATLGCLAIVPLVLEDLASRPLVQSICSPWIHRTFFGGYASYFYMLSKLFELGDTVLIVLRKRPLVVLQYYHHWATMLFVWYSSRFTMELTHCAVLFGTMNYFVHACMYSWYSMSATGVVVPHQLTLCLTFLQFAQMAVGIGIGYIASGCETQDPDRNWQHITAGLVMYGSYLLLFGRLLVQKCTAPPRTIAATGNNKKAQKAS